MQIEKPAATDEKNLTTDINLELIIKTSSEEEFCYYYALHLESERTHSQTSNLIQRAFFKAIEDRS
jgi:hypothetical protein